MKFAPFEPGQGERLRAAVWARRRWLWLLAAVFLVILIYGHFSGKSNGKGAATMPPVAVTTVAAKTGDIDIYLSGLGTVTPIATITIHTRVNGELMKVGYKEGQIVPKGYLLAVIDPRPYEAALLQAQGQLARDKALLANARLDLVRYQTLASEDSIAKQLYDTQKYLVQQDEGIIKIDQGNLDSAKVNVVYTHITAPVAGRIGLRLVDPGNIVQTTDTNGIAVITQLEPITVIFTLPEDSLPPLLERLQAGARLPVDAFNREQTKKLATGLFLAMDNQINVSSGTVQIRAEFPNKDHMLFPNQFVNARLLVNTLRDATLVPTAAIQNGPQGSFVYVVAANQTATVRQVQLGPAEGDNTSIAKGVSPGERVVVEGTERLRDGSLVQEAAPANANPPKAPAAGNPQKAPAAANPQKG
ncbi:MAG: efflux RND transporter periplasmic adaptor subunit [Desulfobaccales bacterium]